MSTRTAIVQRKNALVQEELPLPKVEKNQVLVKIVNSSLNPTDVQSFDGDAFGDGAVLGCDFAGTVEEIGSSVKDLKVGDKIAALVWGGEIKGLGAYSTYCAADEAICFKIPSGLDFAAASTVPLAANTAWLALFSEGSLNIPKSKTQGTSLLVWGGSSTVGAYTIQLARFHGFNIVTTCSPRNFEAVKKHGAKHIFDYNDPDVSKKIAEAVPDLKYGFDCIGNETSSTLSGKAMGGPGKANTDDVPKNVEVTDVLVFTAFLKPHTYKEVYHWPTNPGDHALSRDMYSKIPAWIQRGELVPQRPKDMGVLSVKTLQDAMELNRKGKVSNEKLCFKVADM